MENTQSHYGYIMTENEITAYAAQLPGQFLVDKTKAATKRVESVSSFSKSNLCRGVDDKCLSDTVLSNIYLVHYDEGFAVLSADTRFEQVLIFSESGNVLDESTLCKSGIYSNDGNYTIYDIIELAPYYLSHLQKYVIDYPSYFSDVDSTDANGYYYNNPDYYQTDWVNYEESSLSTGGVWGQESPYNIYCPLYYDFNDGEFYNCPVGCTALAIGEVMEHHAYPDSLSAYYCASGKIPITWQWSYPSVNQESRIIADLLRQIADHLSTDFTPNGSGASFYQIPATLSHFGYSCNTVDTYSFSKIVTAMDQSASPIIVYGDDGTGGTYGHAWLIGGYKRQVRYWLCDWNVYGPDGTYRGRWTSVRDLPPDYSDYVYCNWGQYWEYNVYYSSSYLSFAGIVFNYNTRIITNIHPTTY